MPADAIDPITMLRPRRKIAGISAILLPFTPGGDIDWPAAANNSNMLDATFCQSFQCPSCDVCFAKDINICEQDSRHI